MYRLILPDPRKNIALAFQDVSEARAWLAKQPRAHPQQTLAALAMQVEAIDGSAGGDPALAIELLGLLRTAAVPLQEHIEPRFVRKALPLPADDYRAFELVARFWHRLGVAYLRRYEELGIQGRSLALNRAACALRLAAHSHFLAAYECPVALDRLLLGLLALAIHDNVLARPLPDGDFPHLGAATVGGHLAWAFLLRLIDPYRLTAPQLAVANRALSRWRELAEFRSEPDTDARARNLDLSALYGAPLPDEAPRWLDIRAVDRKLRGRLETLQQGVSPEALKLGRELSPTASIRLLKEVRHSLSMPERETGEEPGDTALAFGSEDAYAVLRGDYLNAIGDIDIDSSVLAHQRTALFGFDRAEQATTAIKRIEVATETWKQFDGMVLRPSVAPGPRRQAPCLVAAHVRGQARLGVLFGLQVMTGDVLSGGLHWYEGEIEAGWLKRTEPRSRASGHIPAFLICQDEELSLVLPATAGVRVGVTLAIGGATLEHLQPDEVLERGVDFVRYACHAV
ncbi:MAG: hypothetical protein LBE81_06855 [Azonexus sp.]|jgi:hypothetical protein|uniref:hypothetical protein n=1 Tax=Azonexus sp. TaxID=1872668 RepID=UPI00282AC39E|nr:hypothetical protein [Azonexus sp.]MDR0776341.1 hypothetical protein [Azonexus sp.]